MNTCMFVCSNMSKFSLELSLFFQFKICLNLEDFILMTNFFYCLLRSLLGSSIVKMNNAKEIIYSASQKKGNPNLIPCERKHKSDIIMCYYNSYAFVGLSDSHR